MIKQYIASLEVDDAANRPKIRFIVNDTLGG